MWTGNRRTTGLTGTEEGFEATGNLQIREGAMYDMKRECNPPIHGI